MRTDYLEPDVWKAILMALTPTNQSIVLLMLYTGLRISDAVSLKTASVKKAVLEGKSAAFVITERKTGKRQLCTIPVELWKKLLDGAGRTYVFEHRLDSRKHRSRQAVWADIKRAAKAFRLEGTISPHSVRKTYAVEMFQETGDLEKVRKLLNHSNTTVTLLYAMADLLSERVKHARPSAPPRAKEKKRP